MHVVRSRGAAARAVVEHHHVGIAVRHLVHHGVVAFDALWLVDFERDGEVHGQDGERIDEQFVAVAIDLVLDDFFELFGRTVVGTQEAGTLADGLLVDLGTCGHHACRVPLHAEKVVAR